MQGKEGNERRVMILIMEIDHENKIKVNHK